MMQAAAISVVGIVFVVAGLATMRKGHAERARGGRIGETETTQVRDLQPGTVEVKGTAHLADNATLLAAPFSETDALATRVVVEEWHTGGEGGGNWETVFEAERAEPIVVDDGTGEVVVDLPPEGGLDLEQTETTVGSDDEPPEAIRQYVENETDLEIPERHSVGPLSVGERRRYHEGVLEPSTDVYVLGTARETAAGWDRRGYVIDEPTAAGDFVLSNKTESDLIDERTRGGTVFLAFGGLLTVVGVGVAVLPWLP